MPAPRAGRAGRHRRRPRAVRRGSGQDRRARRRRQAYDLVHAIHWNLVQYRRDIGYRAIERDGG